MACRSPFSPPSPQIRFCLVTVCWNIQSSFHCRIFWKIRYTQKSTKSDLNWCCISANVLTLPKPNIPRNLMSRRGRSYENRNRERWGIEWKPWWNSSSPSVSVSLSLLFFVIGVAVSFLSSPLSTSRSDFFLSTVDLRRPPAENAEVIGSKL